MKTKKFLLFLILITFFSCKSDKKTAGLTEVEEDRIPVIDIEGAMDNLSSQKFNFSEFASDITYLPLETNDNSIIGGKREPPVNVSENFIFYGDMMFNRDGRFIRKLGKIGQGPGEYVLALGIAVDEDRQEFYVYNNFGRNIYIYDFDNKFKKKIQASDRGSSIFSIGDGKILLFRDFYSYFDDFYEYKVIDVDSEEIGYTRDSGIRENEKTSNVHNLFWRYNNEVFYYEGSTDSIFKLNKNGEIDALHYLVNIGKYKSKEGKNHLRIGGIVESGQFLFFSVHISMGGLYYGAYNKQTEQTVINKFDEFFNNDIDGGFLWLFNSTYNGNEGYKSIFPYLAKERIEMLSSQNTDYNKEKNQKLRQLIKDVKEDDNEIFYFFKLK